MIFVILGTQDKPFQRILDIVEKEIKNCNITDNVVVQNGVTSYNSKFMKLIPFMDGTEFEETISKADLVICHGGYGTLSTALKHRKKIIAVPRLHKYGEHVNDHQIQIVKDFTEKGFLIPLNEGELLSKKLELAKTFIPNEYKSNNEDLMKIISEYII